MNPEPEKLLPCPFCGTIPHVFDSGAPAPGMEDCGYWACVCPKCGGQTGRPFCGAHADTKEEAIAIWNHRPSPSPDGWAMVVAKEIRERCGMGWGTWHEDQAVAILSCHAPAAPASEKPWKVVLATPIFQRHECQVVDVGYADRILTVNCAEIDKALSAPASGWRPIAEAPRDGTEMWGYREDCGTFLMRWTCAADFLTEKELKGWNEEDAQCYAWFYADFIHGGRLEGSEAPAHFMPLPPPPGQTKA